MITVPGYQVVEQLSESSRSLVYRALRRSDQTAVILKILRQEYPSPKAIGRFQIEYNILRSLNLEGVVKAWELTTDQQSPVIVLEDFGGESLQQWLQHRHFDLEEFLTLAIQITSILGEIHHHNIMHKDINPSNIVLNPAEGQVKIIDFGMATVLSQENPARGSPNTLEGTLAYLSPEQTGRMNRTVDYRTDFYSLGVTLYQLLCDRLPFTTTDPLELVHCHLAKQPPAPHHLNPAIPRPVSDLVMKLLAKNAEDRYQSTDGIWADLQECLNQLQQTQSIEAFPIGRWDISSKFQIPQKLYGREQEVETLLAAVNRVLGKSAENGPIAAQAELMLVSGGAGVGKTKLVQELYQSIAPVGGYFIAGKFEQLQRNVPYSALIQAFQALIRQLLTEPAEQIAYWRTRLATALGSNSQVIAAVIPEVEWILGKPPEVIELPPTEAQNRFNWVFQNFIRVFTQPVDPADVESVQPFVIVLDDLQWADPASLQLIQQLVTIPESQSLLLVGTYRDQEVTASHPLMQTLAAIRAAGRRVSQIPLAGLSSTAVQDLIQDTLPSTPEPLLPLAELILQKTDGNPFFIHEFLKFLYWQKLLRFDRQRGIWVWDLRQIQAAQLPDTVVELVLDRIQKLAIPSQQILQLAACIGSQFGLQTLAAVSQQSLFATAANLQAAIQAGLIAPVGEDYPYIESLHQLDLINIEITYQFLHDRIQHIAYSLISDVDRPQFHWKIGQWLLHTTPAERLEAKIFEIVDHLNWGADQTTDPDQTLELARLNLIAGKKAKASVAYEPALNYLNRGRSWLAEDSWQQTYDLTLALAEATAEAAYLTGNFELMEHQVEAVLRHAQTTLEQTGVYLVKIQADIARNRMMDAIQTALQVLEKLGIHLPQQPNQADITQALSQTKQLLASKQTEDLLRLAPMRDPTQLAAMKLIASVCTPTYFLVPELWELMVCQKIQLSVHYGNAPGSAFGYADYGMILCGVENNLEAGCQFARLAATLQPQLNAKEFIPKTSLLVNMYLRHWHEPLQATLNPLLEAYQTGLETGDLEYATFAIAFRFYHAYLVGQELTQLAQEMARSETTIAQFQQELPLNLIRLYRQAVRQLIGQVDSEVPFLTTEDPYLQFHQSLNQLILCYLFQDHAQAIEHAIAADRLLSAGAIGLLTVPVFYFYDSLARIAVFPDRSPAEQQQILQTIDTHQAKMNHWANHAPMNYSHQFHLVEAERYRILGQFAAAADAYDRAIELARENDYLQHEALANELAAKFYLARNKPKIAQVYLLDARYGYLRWGATAKVEQLDQQDGQILDRGFDRTLAIAGSSSAIPRTTSSSTTEVVLDWAALMKASQALSNEIVLDQLLTTLMTILMENAGAERGYLILEIDGQLQIAAAGSVKPEQVTVLPAISIATANDRMASAIVHYVARTQESVVLNQAAQDTRFNQDAYILEHQPQSVLCTPLVYQGKRSGILYLENNLTPAAFTPERLEILQFLSTQAAISIENAQLYNQLELRVQHRTIELTQMNDRLQAEVLERQRSEQALRLIVEGTASVVGEDFFRSLVRSLAEALQVRYALISGCVDVLPTRVRTFAFWRRNEFGDNFEYDLAGTPCEQVIRGKSCQFYAANLQAQFPDDETLVNWQAESYLGITLLSSTGQILGHLAVLDDQPMPDQPRNQAILEIFATRAATELERKQAEEALRLSEDKFSKAFRSSPNAIILSTLDAGHYIEVNQNCLRMLGYSQAEMIGFSAVELDMWVNPDDRAMIQQQLQETGAVSQVEFRFRRKSGETFPGLYSAEVIQLENQPCLLSVISDITALKQAEQALERLAEIGELAAMIVHEVRNPLTTLLMSLNAFKRLQLTERFQEYLALALDEADRLQRLLNQILLYAKPQTVHRSELALYPLIVETLSTLQQIPQASGKHLELVAPSKSLRISADRDQLKQVFINLVTNACEAVEEGATITIYLQAIENHQVCLQVHNGGEPIPAEVLPKLTKPFFTTKPSGNGLGLAIVKRIIEAHGGEFSITSSAATGTTVTVQLPIVI